MVSTYDILGEKLNIQVEAEGNEITLELYVVLRCHTCYASYGIEPDNINICFECGAVVHSQCFDSHCNSDHSDIPLDDVVRYQAILKDGKIIVDD